MLGVWAPNVSRSQGLPLRDDTPFAQFTGLPGLADARKLPNGDSSLAIYNNRANQFVLLDAPPDPLRIDLESNITEIHWRRGFQGLELEAALPWVNYGGGFMDGPISGWHHFFGLPNGGREDAPEGQTRVSYQGHDARDSVALSHPVQGLGDVRLTLGWQMVNRSNYLQSAQVLLKLPTGDSHQLLGNDAFNAALYSTHRWTDTPWRFDAQYGLLWMQASDVLPEQQRHWAGFGTVAVARAVPWFEENWQAILQLDAHTALYERSDKAPLGDAAMLSWGLRYQRNDWALHLMMEEDIKVQSTPDFGFLLGIEWFFNSAN